MPPELPSQRAAREAEQRANSVEWCETRSGHRTCRLVPRSEVDRILRGGL